MAKSTLSRSTGKSAKPWPDDPLFPQATGRRVKKIRPKTHFFGRCGHKQGNGVVPVDDVEASAAEARKDYAVLSDHPYSEYYRTCKKVIAHVGHERLVDSLQPSDVEVFRGSLAKSFGVVTLRTTSFETSNSLSLKSLEFRPRRRFCGAEFFYKGTEVPQAPLERAPATFRGRFSREAGSKSRRDRRHRAIDSHGEFVRRILLSVEPEAGHGAG